MIPDDLRHLPNLGAFQFVPGDACVLALCALLFFVCVFPDLVRPVWRLL